MGSTLLTSRCSFQAGETRNLSTAILLASLVNSIITDSGRTHYLCGYHPEYQMYLTWGFEVGVMGTREPNAIELYDWARGDLRALLARRADVTEMIKADLSAP
jgi:hypothetical protein